MVLGGSEGVGAAFARQLAEAGFSLVLVARKPDPLKAGARREIEADFCAWEAPARYLVGYGLDDAGRFRALPYIGVLD